MRGREDDSLVSSLSQSRLCMMHICARSKVMIKLIKMRQETEAYTQHVHFFLVDTELLYAVLARLFEPTYISIYPSIYRGGSIQSFPFKTQFHH